VGSKDGVGVAGGEESAEEGVSRLASSLFDGLAVLRRACRNIGAVDVKWNVELDAKILHKGEIGIGF
jgi:hypothetical protein